MLVGASILGITFSANICCHAGYNEKKASSAVCEKLASNDDFEIVVRQIENLKAHIFKISVSICLSKHCPSIEFFVFFSGTRLGGSLAGSCSDVVPVTGRGFTGCTAEFCREIKLIAVSEPVGDFLDR